MPYGGVLKDERPTSNVERRIMMSLRFSNFLKSKKKPTPNIQRLFLFLRLFPFNIRSAGGGQVLARLWRVGRSMFDVHFFQSLLGKNNLALMGERPSPPPRLALAGFRSCDSLRGLPEYHWKPRVGSRRKRSPATCYWRLQPLQATEQP